MREEGNFMEELRKPRETTFLHALAPILFLLVLIVYGLIFRPLVQKEEPFPLEVIFILAAAFCITQLFWMGYRWEQIQDSIVSKLAKALPAFFILFSIGLIIASWMVCGTIPMLVYYGLKTINPTFLYLLAFIVPIIFSTLTGTSWGSAGSIGVVIIGIAIATDAHLGITAGAIIGGAYFGDKMSPLSDTTNMAALATDVNLFDHIHSMMYTTIPSAIVAATLYTILGFYYTPEAAVSGMDSTTPFLTYLDSIFKFNFLLLLPPIIVLYGSLRRKATIPTLLCSVLVATVLALLFQKFSLTHVLQSLNKGFLLEMADWVTASEAPQGIIDLLNRGGLYSMSEAIFVAFMVFVFIGAMDLINAMPIVVNRIFQFAKSRASTILSTLAASAITNSLTSNQYATSFIVGDAFKAKYDALKIPRKVLSRSLEDTGTMVESIIPWHPTAVYMFGALGVSCAEYWHWQFLSLTNFIVAPTLAILGIGCFYHLTDKAKNNR